ncbi:MAG: cysteine--tRNA ligase [Elusimicrobia bacterium]|nr:cysteine--tRNA ligase [Elusimicrobiota bacterium]
MRSVPILLYNTLSRRTEEFSPSSPEGIVGIYTCGPTVYNHLHIGNYRTYVFEDCLRRTLEFLGLKVRHVMNITDVGHMTSQADEGEDKMEVGAAREGKTAWEIAEFYTKSFLEDSKKLNLEAPDVLCRATDNILEQIALIKRLEEKGFTYRASDGVYFDTSKFQGYGRLAGGQARIEGLQEGARVVANAQKRNPTDFALWKFSPAGAKRQMEWDSPWGKGFPGWHIECSAMSMKHLGESFDIHCGGVDHIPIHHTNEIAQAEAATGKPFVRFWLHGEFLVLNKAKMAKSSGGFIRLKDAEEKGFDALDYRYFCFGAHYRRQLEFSWEALEAARTARRKLRDRGQELLKVEPEAGPDVMKALEAFRSRIAEDLDMPGAVASLWDAMHVLPPAGQRAYLQEADKVLGLRLLEPAEDKLSEDLQALFDRYCAARKAKDFAASDALRKDLAAKGIKVKDARGGSTWSRG